MRNLSIIALFVLLAMGISGGQQTIPSAPAPSADTQPAPVKVYAVGPGVTAPEFLPLDLSPFSTEKCRKKMDGKVKLALLVDTTGKSRNIVLDDSLNTAMDRLAFKIVGADRFNPGTYDGAPVVVGESVEVNMHVCAEQTKEDVVNKTYRLRLRSEPEQKFTAIPQPPKEAILASGDTAGQVFSLDGFPVYHIGGSVTAPAPLSTPNAEFSDEARLKNYQGVCILSVVVDENGKPRNIQVVRKLGMGLDEKAVEAVRKYRFKPAMKNGVPVPVSIMIEVAFRLY